MFDSMKSRRNVLKSTGLAAATVGSFSAVVTAKQEESPQKKYEAALRVREKTGSNEKFRNVLKQGNAKIATDDVSETKVWRTSSAEEGEFTTQKLQKADFNLSMTMTSYNNSHPYVDLHWEITVDYDLQNNDGGELPADIIGLTFEPRDYDFDDYAYGGNSTNKRDSGYMGATYEYSDITCEDYNDAGASCPPEIGTTVTVKDSAGMRIKPDETSDPSYRKVYADYYHTWNQTEIDSVGIESAGQITVNLSNNDKKWTRPLEASISEDELTYENCC